MCTQQHSSMHPMRKRKTTSMHIIKGQLIHSTAAVMVKNPHIPYAAPGAITKITSYGGHSVELEHGTSPP